MSQRLIVARYQADLLQPQWCQSFVRLILDHILSQKCDLLLFGNNRGLSADLVLVQAARMAGVTTVGELLNLFVDEMSVPDVLVGPSYYAVEHSLLQATKNTKGRHPYTTVISPAVDLERFRPAADRFHSSKDGDRNGVIYIGFFARLSIEKNPGLFLLSARELLSQHPFCRFVVIGDGEVRQNLEELAERLQISWAMEFVGMLAGPQLVATLRRVDIVVNPSLRAWSETFCIANIEVMAMGIPLVTFGVGGIGQYIELLPRVDQRDEAAVDEKYTIAKNAILLNEASPTVIANAVTHLIQNVSLRHALGRLSLSGHTSALILLC